MSSFSKDALERTARTVVQSSAAAVLALWIQAGSFNELDWSTVWQVALFSAGFTILTALAGKSTGSPDNASFTK
jgi:ABC-type enterobactin transport system permease subunit